MISIYRNGTTGLANGTLEIPGDGTGVAIGQPGSVGVIHLRAPSGQSTTETVTVDAPPDCTVSRDGTTFTASVPWTAGENKVTALTFMHDGAGVIGVATKEV